MKWIDWTRAAALAAAAALAGCADGVPVGGTLAEGLRDAEAASDRGDVEGALAQLRRMEPAGAAGDLAAAIDGTVRGASPWIRRPVQALATTIGLGQLSAEARAELAFARGLVMARGAGAEGAGTGDGSRAELIEGAVRAFETARSLGGAPRAEAVEALGTLQLAAAEALRMQIPELGLAPAPGSGAGADAEEDGPDPIETARAAYLGARAHHVEALRLGLDSASLEANVDLCIRRLRELDALEQQRQEQQDRSSEGEDDEKKDGDDSGEEESKDPKDGDPEDQQNEEKDPSKDSSESESEEDPSKSQDPEDEPSKDESRREPEEDPSADPESSEDESADDDRDLEQADPEDAPRPENETPSDRQPEAPPESQIEETRMTAEELKRLLEASREYQEQGEKQRMRLRRLRRIPAKRDW